jgi:multidrug efflux pump subunit AcrB
VRVLNRVLATVLALVLLLGGLLAAVEIVLARLGRPPVVVPRDRWSAWVAAQTWEVPAVRAVLVLVTVVGLLLVVAGARRGKPAALALPAGEAPPGVRASASRRTVEKALADAVRDVDGVVSAHASAGRRRVTVRATSMSRAGGAEQHVREAVDQSLRTLGLAGSLRPRVTMSYEERS